ncbi:MAG: MucBP domain-containing protein, partial [Lachnospiraceae bacterium]|nr:MucBP domain-containing protein [Lachnospiraceae bacterium]
IVPAKYTILAYSRASGDSTASVEDVSVSPSRKVIYDESVTVTAPDKSAQGYSFLGWHEVMELTAEGNEVESYYDAVLCDKLSYTFTAWDEDMALVAVYEARGNAQVKVSAVNYAEYYVGSSPTAQSGSTENVQLGTTLVLTAVDADKVLCWMNESNKVLGTKESLSLVVTGDTAVTLVYRPEATNGAFVQFENDFGQVLGYKSYSQGDVKVDYPGIPSKFGFTFEKWVFKGTNEEASQEEILARVANGGVITVVPKYMQDDRKYVVTVRYQDAEGAEIRTEDEFPEILVGTGYTVTAPAVDGYAFSCWKDSNGTILGYNESYYFLVASDNSLTAVYAADGSAQQTQAQPVITIGVPSAVTTTDAHKVSCTVTRSIPDGYELQEHGILYAKGVEGLNETTFVYGTAGVSKYQSDKTSTSGVVKLNVKVSGEAISSGDNMNVSFRGYMILKDNATGNVVTYYTDIASGNYAALSTQN